MPAPTSEEYVEIEHQLMELAKHNLTRESPKLAKARQDRLTEMEEAVADSESQRADMVRALVRVLRETRDFVQTHGVFRKV